MISANNILPQEAHINNDYVLKIYKIGFPKCKPNFGHHMYDCKNPHCLSNIKQFHVNVETEHKLRKANAFVGLKNLGATCYVNSLLQLWFHNKNIRNAILKWDPMDNKDENKNHTLFIENVCEPMTEIGHLQLVFALMQFGNQPTIDPQSFIDSFKIDVNIQEDAVEFQSRMITLFYEKSNSKSNVSVREMVKDNFFGEYNSVTICLNCKTESVTSSQFREICLNIKCHKTITDSLQEYFKKEKMIDDEKYFCVQCNNKQNAVRQIVLTSLPQLLHLKLMRYVYDNNLMTTIKLNTEIRCPYTIDMSRYFDLSHESSKETHIYKLYGVLIHKGQNANVGHFITHIKDLKTEKWYEMDDENVKMLNTNNSNLHNGNIFKGLITTKSINIQTNEYITDNAYMLVYMSASTVLRLKTEPSNFTLSPQLTQLVKIHNDDYENIISYELEKIEFELFLSNLITEIKSTKVVKDDGDAISVQWLKSLAETRPCLEVNKINNNSILCSHNKLNPNALHMTKYIGTELADKLYGLYNGGPRLKLNLSLCEVCVRNRSALLCMSNLTNEHKQLISRIQKFASTNNNSEAINNVETFWMGIKSLKFWQLKYLKMFQNFLKFNKILPNSTLPLNQEELVVTCTSLIGILDETLFKDIIEENDNETDDMEKILFEPDYSISVYDSKDIMKDYFEDLEHQCTEILLKSYTEIKDLDSIFIDNTEEAPWKLNEDITCPHGNLCIAKETMILVPEGVRNILRNYFPKVQFFTRNTKPCSLCKAYYKNIYIPKMLLSMDALLQEKFVNTLMFDDTRPNTTEENCPYFCIPKDFLVSWQKFIIHPFIEPKPLMINNKSLLCKDHNELLFEPTCNFLATDQSVSVILTKNEWLNLIDYYQADCGIFVYFDKKGIFQKSIPKVCQTCTKTLGEEKNQFKDYINAKIFIQVSANNFKCYETDNEYEVLGNSVKKFKQDVASTNNASEYEAAAASSIDIYNSTSDYGTRSIRKQISQYQSITMSSNDTVFLLKNKIEELFNVSPTNQILKTASGKPLIENEAKLRDLKIYPESVIIAKFIDANLTKNVAVEETGFKGMPN